MNDHQKRIRLAEVDGITVGLDRQAVPDYFRDLNATASLAGKLFGPPDNPRWCDYGHNICRVYWGDERFSYAAIHVALLCSSANTRAEALFQTLFP